MLDNKYFKTDKILTHARAAACFFCAVTVLLGSVPHLVRGIFDNLGYNRYEGRVTYISEFTPAANMFVNGVPINTAEGGYEYFTENGAGRTGSFTVYEWEQDEYFPGSEYAVYTHNEWSGDISEASARSRMTDNIVFPLIFVIPALIAAAAGAVRARGVGIIFMKDVFPKSFAFSVVSSLLAGAATVYAVFIFEGGTFLGGLEEAFANIEAAAFCFIVFIAEIIVWSSSVRRERKKLQEEL